MSSPSSWPKPVFVDSRKMADATPGGPVQPGAVYLVGAGPGAVGQLTVRAVEVLTSCDVVLHDRLVPQAVVQLCKPTAEVRYVGKDGNVGTGKMKKHQDEISLQLVELAKKGLSVCRLKGGDPMIYGRAGEEMELCVAHDVPYEVVPAVTAALAAGADARVPLTFRNAATSVRFHTLNPSTTRDEKYDWSQFAAPMTTYALYMGLSALEGVCSKMMAAGVDGSTPMAVIDQAGWPTAKVVAGTVSTLPAIAKSRTDLEGPAICLMGSAVGMRDKLMGRAPPASPEVDASLMAAKAFLPSLGDEALRNLRESVDALLASRAAAAPRSESGEPLVKKPAVSSSS